MERRVSQRTIGRGEDAKHGRTITWIDHRGSTVRLLSSSATQQMANNTPIATMLTRTPVQILHTLQQPSAAS